MSIPSNQSTHEGQVSDLTTHEGQVSDLTQTIKNIHSSPSKIEKKKFFFFVFFELLWMSVVYAWTPQKKLKLTLGITAIGTRKEEIERRTEKEVKANSFGVRGVRLSGSEEKLLNKTTEEESTLRSSAGNTLSTSSTIQLLLSSVNFKFVQFKSVLFSFE